MAELVLGGGKVEVGGALEVAAGLALAGAARGDEGREEVRGHRDVGKLGEEVQAEYVRGLWDVDGRDGGGALEEGNGGLGVGGETELAHEVGHAHALRKRGGGGKSERAEAEGGGRT